MSKTERAGRVRSGPVRPIGEALEQLIEELGIARTLKQYDVLTLWDSIVGEQIARVTQAQRIEKGVLFVHVFSAPWRAELTLKRREIIQRINAMLDGTVITDIRFR